MPNFDVTSPIGFSLRGEGASILRLLKNAVQSALRGGLSEGLEGIFPGASPATSPVFRYRGKKGDSASTPSVADGGLYFNSERAVLRRSNGSTWDDVGSSIPSGTVMSFYQSSAPTGWTAVAVNDKFLRVVTNGTSGGANGGSLAASSSLSHTHTIQSHVHNYSHYHKLDHDDVSVGHSGSVTSSRSKGSYAGVNSASGTSWEFTNRTLFYINDDVLPALVLPAQSTGAGLAYVMAASDVVLARKD